MGEQLSGRKAGVLMSPGLSSRETAAGKLLWPPVSMGALAEFGGREKGKGKRGEAP